MGCVSKVIATYIAAKDGGPPWLMRRALAEDAVLETEVRTDAISYPSVARGRAAVADALVRRFSADCENVYTFRLAAPPETAARAFRCGWLVGMSRRDSGELRVGCGCCDWAPAPDRPLVGRRRIDVEVMAVLPPNTLPAIMAWLATLPYPWLPALDGVQAIGDHLDARR